MKQSGLSEEKRRKELPPKCIRGQVSSGEIIIAYFIFFVALTISVTMWLDSTNRIQNTNTFSDFEDAASDLAEKLVRTKGIPASWTEDDVTTIGFADEPRMLNPEKIHVFVDMMNDSKNSTTCPGYTNYECNKELLGIGKYDFYLAIEDLNGNPFRVNNTPVIAGKLPANETDTITITRASIVNNTIIKLKVTLWYINRGTA